MSPEPTLHLAPVQGVGDLDWPTAAKASWLVGSVPAGVDLGQAALEPLLSALLQSSLVWNGTDWRPAQPALVLSRARTCGLAMTTTQEGEALGAHRDAVAAWRKAEHRRVLWSRYGKEAPSLPPPTGWPLWDCPTPPISRGGPELEAAITQLAAQLTGLTLWRPVSEFGFHGLRCLGDAPLATARGAWAGALIVHPTERTLPVS